MVVTVFLLSSCANMPDSMKDLAQDESVQGGVIGGLACGIGAKLLGANNQQIALATAGCGAVGAMIGIQFKDRRQKYASDEAFVDGEISAAKSFNAEKARYKNQLVADVSGLKTENLRIASLQRRGKVSKQKLANHVAVLKNKQQKVKIASKQMQDELKFQEALHAKIKQETPNDSRLASLQQEVNKLRETIDVVENQQSQLANLNDNLI